MLDQQVFEYVLDFLIGVIEDCPPWADLEDCVDFTIDNFDVDTVRVGFEDRLLTDAELEILDGPLCRTALLAGAALITGKK